MYFIEICAPLRFVDLDVFGRRLHQLRVRSRGQHLAFHQENDLVVILHRRDFLRHRDQRDAGIFSLNVLENGPLRVGIHSRREIVEQQHLADSAPAPGPASRVVSVRRRGWFRARKPPCPGPCGSVAIKSLKLGRRDRLLHVLLRNGGAEGNVLPKRHIEQDAVLKYEADLPVQCFLVVGLQRLRRRKLRSRMSGCSSPIRTYSICVLPGRGGTDNGRRAAGLRRKRNVFEDFLVPERERNAGHRHVAAQNRPELAGFLGVAAPSKPRSDACRRRRPAP